MSGNRPISRLERLVEDLPASSTRELIAREFLAGAIRRFPQLTVDETVRLFDVAASQLRHADERMDAILGTRPKLGHLDEKTRASIERGTKAAQAAANGKAKKGVTSVSSGRHRKRRSRALLDKIRQYRARHPDQTNVARAYREIGPDISEKAFRGYWAAASED